MISNCLFDSGPPLGVIYCPPLFPLCQQFCGTRPPVCCFLPFFPPSCSRAQVYNHELNTLIEMRRGLYDLGRGGGRAIAHVVISAVLAMRGEEERGGGEWGNKRQYCCCLSAAVPGERQRLCLAFCGGVIVVVAAVNISSRHTQCSLV